MPYYRYKAVNRDGSMLKGVVEAADFQAAYTTTETTGLYVLNVSKSNDTIAALLNRFRARRVQRKEVIEFSNNLAAMIRAGIPISTALDDMVETADNNYFNKKIDAVRNGIAMGSSFTDAVRIQGAVFPDIFLRLVSVGEETGRLEASLRDAADHLQRVEDLASAIKSALIYPIFALVTTSGAMLFWLIYVLPKVLTLFDDLDMEIPAITGFLIGISNFTQRFWPLLIVLPIILFVAVKLLKRNRKFAYAFDLAKLKVPILKLILENKILGIFTEQMRILMRAGLTIDRSFDLVSEVMGNVVYKDALVNAKEEILAGSTITDALRNQQRFTTFLLRMTHVGESSGTLEDQFAYMSDYYIKKLNDISEKLGKMLEPIIIIVLGIIFGFLIVGLLVPIYDLVSQMGSL